MIKFQLLLLQTLWFFLQIIRELNHSYPNLFNAGDEEIDEKGERSSKEISITEEDSSGETNSEFSQKWNWICWIDRVSEVTRLNWHQVYDMQIQEFLNIICYLLDKGKEEKRQIDLWKAKH